MPAGIAHLTASCDVLQPPNIQQRGYAPRDMDNSLPLHLSEFTPRYLARRASHLGQVALGKMAGATAGCLKQGSGKPSTDTVESEVLDHHCQLAQPRREYLQHGGAETGPRS